MIWLVLVLGTGFLLAVPFLGADSRDGRDWHPLRLPSPVPDTDRSLSPPTGARQVAKGLRAKLMNWRAGRQRKVRALTKARPAPSIELGRDIAGWPSGR